tara:strand:+ start:56 stop:934 length:879 start_codon:yes stop_codon:yes gene_type:complete
MISKGLLGILRSVAKYSKNIAKGRKYRYKRLLAPGTVGKQKRQAKKILFEAFKRGEISKDTLQKGLKSHNVIDFVKEMFAKRVPQGPILKLASAVSKPKMGRREFLGRSGGILSESKMQANLAKAVTDLSKEQRAANAWLMSPGTQNKLKRMRVFSSEPMYKSGGDKVFKKKLKKSLEISTYGYQNPFGYSKYLKSEMKTGGPPKKASERWFYWRQKLAETYGHRFGTGSYLGDTFKMPGASVVRTDKTGRQYVGQPWNENAGGVLGYIKDLRRAQNTNPILQAFREGLYGK